MIPTLIVLTAVALITPQVLPGIKVKGIATALLIAVVFTLLNLLIGWLLHFVFNLLALPLVLLTLGLFSIVVTAFVNALLLKLTDSLLDNFEIKGWWPALGMGLLFAVGAQLARMLT